MIERKRIEEEAASVSKPVDNPEAIVTSSPGTVLVIAFSGQEFSSASRSPVPENLRQDKSMDTSVIAFVIDKKELQEQEDDCIICRTFTRN